MSVLVLLTKCHSGDSIEEDEKRNAHRELVGKPKGESPLGSLGMDGGLKGIGTKDVDWNHLSRDKDR